MADHYQLVQRLTEPGLPLGDRRRLLNDFAAYLGWRPSDAVEIPGAGSFSTAHLVVEHGLQNTAVISFLSAPHRFPDLTFTEKNLLVNASYNNLVDWHLGVDFDGVSFAYNRAAPPEFYSYRRQYSRTDSNALSGSHFDVLSTDHPPPSIPALDDAVIRTISFWKKQLAAEVPNLSTSTIASLFNCVILARAIEDQQLHLGTDQPQEQLLTRANHAKSVRELVESALLPSLSIDALSNFADLDALAALAPIDMGIVRELVADFYRNRFARHFQYDFSLMSKHALSRIYEHYVSLLRASQSTQTAFFPQVPTEVLERSFGNVYTPEFIARFFAKYLRKQLPLRRFQKLKVIDPACGSGIFLRALLETRFSTSSQELTTDGARDSFDSVTGIDIDANACEATKLSLSLLSLAITGSVPASLSVFADDALRYFAERPELEGTFEAVLANPPFVNVENQSEQTKGLIASVLGQTGGGRSDLYLAILKVALEALRPDGYGLFVLPQNFLLSDNARGMRELLLRDAWLECVVDLSAIRVFEDVGAYVVLLVFRKKTARDESPPVLVVKCQDLVGTALEDALNDRPVRNNSYSIYWQKQPEVVEKEWLFPAPEVSSALSKARTLPTLGELVELRQGVITGADNVFILGQDELPTEERDLFIPFLPDRDIQPFVVPQKAKRYVFYPYHGGNALTEASLRKNFPNTWNYLRKHREALENRKSVLSGKVPWWRPAWPRSPRKLLRPKIVSPHLVIAPRFALDVRGKFAVSHTPYVIVREEGPTEAEQLKYFLAVLNSSPGFWFISKRAHAYQRGYSRLEVSTLSETPVPDPSLLDPTALRAIVKLVDRRMVSTGSEALEIERRLDNLIASIYQLSAVERELMGMKSHDV
jgi:methylase of polypeptide subunit release factors